MIYPPTPSTPAPTSDAPLVEQPPTNARGNRFAVGFAIAAVAITLGAILLAALAPSFNSASAPTVPSGWRTVYDADLRPGDPRWSNQSGCVLESQGLHVTGQENIGIVCPFAPSKTQRLLSNGFMLTLTLAPGASVQSLEEALVVLGESGEVRIDQSGRTVLCTPSCASSGDRNQLDVFAWHGQGANTFTLRWLGAGNPLELYTNGQQATTIPFSFTSTNQLLEIGTPKNDEAIYTHMTLYSAS